MEIVLKRFQGKYLRGKLLFLASGAYVKRDNKFFPKNPFIAGSSVVKGSYGIFDDIDLGESGFVFSCGKANLVYRREVKQVVIGGTTDRDEGWGPDSKAVQEQYKIVSKFFSLPPFNCIRLGAGLRHRGAKRMPFWGRLSENVYGILGLYKNGWSLSFLAAEEILMDSGIE